MKKALATALLALAVTGTVSSTASAGFDAATFFETQRLNGR